MLELTTEKNNVDTENTNIVNISNENDDIENQELKRNFYFKNNKTMNSSSTQINNKVEELSNNSSSKSINTIVNSHSNSRVFIENSKTRNMLFKLNFDNVKRSPANGNYILLLLLYIQLLLLYYLIIYVNFF